MNVAPAICPRCGHRFPLGSPERLQCRVCRYEYPDHGESKALEKQIADELLVRREQRAFWVRWFWVLLLIGPCHAVAFVLFKQDIVSSVPMAYRAFAEIGCSPVLALGLSAAGAGFCLAKLWFPVERLRDVLAYAFLIGFVFMAIYGGLFVAVSLVVAILDRPVP